MLPFQGSPPQIENEEKFTGKRLVMLDPEANYKKIQDQAQENVSLRLAPSSDYKKGGEAYRKAFDDADGIVFERFGVAVINEDHEQQVKSLTESAKSKTTFLYSEPERFVYALDSSGGRTANNLLGLWQAICRLFGFKPKDPIPIIEDYDFKDDDIATWGVHSLNLLKSNYTGKGINIAILDTGFNLDHADFLGRSVSSQSFITGEEVADGNGHGTHCSGIAAGDVNKESKVRYGVAKDSNIYIGKVLSNKGVGSDSGIIAGLDWALSNKCRVISMSLGASVSPGQAYSKIYDDIGKNAMELGTLIIAAAGNDSNRKSGKVSPVNHPANCPSIMAVGALDNRLGIANFSCGGINSNGGEVDIAAPGVAIYSSYKTPQNYGIISGTSMATPFVAGVAALLWEKNPKAKASEIWNQLTSSSKKLNLPGTDVGSGLVQLLEK